MIAAPDTKRQHSAVIDEFLAFRGLPFVAGGDTNLPGAQYNEGISANAPLKDSIHLSLPRFAIAKIAANWYKIIWPSEVKSKRIPGAKRHPSATIPI